MSTTMKRSIAPLLLLALTACFELDITSSSTNNNTAQPTPTPSPTPVPKLPTGAICSSNFECESLNCGPDAAGLVVCR